jgi:DHA1 family bicyclomycin/chloramphenicol resistance-like MFS transporter
MQQSNNLPKYFVVILAMLTSISPLAIDVYLPSFSQISKYFYTSIDQIEITLSIYLVGFGLGQLVGGPLSDRYGRKIFIYMGLGVYIIFSFLISIASSLEELWIFRFFQALGGGFAVVNTNAIVRDLFHGKEGAKVFAVISMIMMLAPMIAPVIGITILHFFEWQYIFIFLSLYALILINFIRMLPETSPKIKTDSLFSNYQTVFANKVIVVLMFASGLGFSGLFIFITKASFIYMEYFKQDMIHFGMFFSLNVVSLMIWSKVNIMLLDRFSSMQLLLSGMSFQLFVGIYLLAISSFANLYEVVVGFMLFIGSLGFVFGNSIALILERFGKLSASATALNGVVGFMVAGLIGLGASLVHNGTLTPIFVLMCATTTLSLIILLLIRKKV